MSVLPSDVVLSHYGVLGMKWGVRKDRVSETNPKSSKETVKKAKTHAKEALKPSVEARMDRIFLKKPPIKYSELSTKDVTIKRGQELARITHRKDEKLSDMTYASYTKEDRLRYKSVMANVRGISYAKRSYKPTYEVIFKATQDLKSPSEKARFDAFVDLVDTPSIPIGRRGKVITGREYLKRSGYKYEIKKLDDQRIGEAFYYQFVAEQHANTPLNKAYFDSLRSKGYNALMDDNDRGILSDEPLMILDTKGAIKKTSVRQLTNDEINAAAASLTPVKTKT